MKSKKSTNQTADNGFSLDLVASIAAQPLSGQALQGDREQIYKHAADNAIALLEACEARLFFDEDVRLRRYQAGKAKQKEETEKSELTKKYPNGVPWVKGLLFITGKKSETEAFAPFKRWRMYACAEPRAAPLRASFEEEYRLEPDSLDAEDVQKELEGLKMCGFTPSKAVEERTAFQVWYKRYGIPDERKKAGTKGGSK